MSKKSFADLGVSKAIVSTLAERGIREPFAIQRLVIADVLAGHDVLAKSPTGSGKTFAFAIPIVERLSPEDHCPSALVLAPTRELASQIVEESRSIAKKRGLRIAAVYGGVGLEQQARIAARAQIVVATPGRLEDLLARKKLTLRHVRILVLDEGDRMLDMGFRPPVDRIVRQCSNERQTLFFGATLEGQAGRVAATYTRNAKRRDYSPPGALEATVDHRFIAVKAHQRVDALVEELEQKRELALVFVRTKRGAERLVTRLGKQDVRATAMHGDKSQGQREKALAHFESSEIDTLIATDVAARGIDVDNISHVINFDPPEDRDGYLHRVGRTGRAGRDGIGITFVGTERAREVARLAAQLDLTTEFEQAGVQMPRFARPTESRTRKPRVRSYRPRSHRR